jgi:hypothetical protein
VTTRSARVAVARPEKAGEERNRPASNGATLRTAASTFLCDRLTLARHLYEHYACAIERCVAVEVR